MGLFGFRNKSNSVQQHGVKKLVPVVTTYPHRLDADGNPLVRVRFVQSTAEPNYRYHSLFVWALHVRMMLILDFKRNRLVYNPFKRDK